MIQPDYSLVAVPVEGRVVLRHGDVVVAASERARVMHETGLRPTIYLPREDVIGLAGTPGSRRSFCPFKGTASYWDLTISGRTYPDAAWSYDNALPDAAAIRGMVAISADLVGRDANVVLPPPGAAARDGGGAFLNWLLHEAPHCRDGETLMGGFCRALAAYGVPLQRANVMLWSLHPQIAGVSYLWTRASDDVKPRIAPYDDLVLDTYMNSPIRHVTDGLGGVRQPLTGGEPEFDFPIMDELRREGATDYVAMPLTFSDGQHNVLTLATDHPDGFSTAHLGLVFQASGVLARLFEVQTLRVNAATLLGTYLGTATGARVLGGEIRRGDGQDIDATILFCDLRGSTSLESALDRDTYLAVLNTFFETAVGLIRQEGGEVLKFIGDAVLAIFPDEGDTGQSSAHAVRAALATVDALADLSIPGLESGPSCASGIAHGRVTYGNVGSPDRLDFTVIGAPANIAARLSDLGKATADPVVMTEAVARASGFPYEPRGEHRLHNVAGPVAVFAARRAGAGQAAT
ncbi:MAG: DUF427 domain-containing protein [Rhodobiaceae bacterium]|nr:DUF427 domain-containing protein [Rhodobiaceae bacterium]